MKKIKNLPPPPRKIGLIAIFACGMFAACNKDCKDISNVAPAAANSSSGDITGDAAKRISARLDLFYERMKDLKGGIASKGMSDEIILLDSAEFLVEGVYNKQAVEKEFDQETEEVKFEIRKPLENGGLRESKVAEAFWQIKDSLMAVYSTVAYADKRLSALDVRVTVDGSDAKIEVTGGIDVAGLSHPPFGNCQRTFTTANTRVYSMWLNGGQADFDYSTGAIEPLTDDNSLPSARTLLESYGLWNYYNCSARACGYFVSINNIADQEFYSDIAPTTNDYVNRGVPDFYNTKAYSCRYYFQSIAPYTNYYVWFNTDMDEFLVEFYPRIHRL